MADTYPLTVEVNEKNILKIRNTYQEAYKDIVEEITTATDWGVRNRKAILAQIEDILEELGTDVDEFIASELPKYYETGADDAVKQLRNVKAPVNVSTGFNKIHKDAIAGLVDETSKAFGESLAGVNRQAQLVLGRMSREMLTQKMATGIASGKALREVRQQLKGQIQEDGLVALIDRGGREWSLDRYAEMLFRTKAVETRNRGIANRLVENGFDLVQVSNHNSSHAECALWEGKVLSASGQTRGYPTVAEAERGGLFHPNCQHAINILNPKLANMTRAYDPRRGAYSPAGASMRGEVLRATKKSVVNRAAKYQGTFKNHVASIADKGGWEYSHGPVKKVGRSTDKVIDDYNGDPGQLRDANRAVIFINNPHDEKEIKQLQAAITEVWDIERTKHGLVTDYVGYKKTLINVNLPPGHVGEIQVTTKEMWEAKTTGGGQKLYNEIRASQDKLEALEKKMNKLYAEAEAAALERLGIGKP